MQWQRWTGKLMMHDEQGKGHRRRFPDPWTAATVDLVDPLCSDAHPQSSQLGAFLCYGQTFSATKLCSTAARC